MRLVQITRYPVKSLQGETVSSAEIQTTGMHGDRCWGIRDEASGKILTARRAPVLLWASAALAADGMPVIALPNGAICHGPGPKTDSALSAWLGKPVRLVSSLDTTAARAEFFADATDDSSEAIEWTMPNGRFVDALPLLVLSTASLRTAAALHPDGDWDLRRFRANLVVDIADDGWAEDDWYGAWDLCVGTVRLRPQEGCIRCTMVTRPQPGLREDRDVFRTLARHHNARFGAWSTVAAPGTVTVGDAVDPQPRIRPSVAAVGDLGAQRRSDEDDPSVIDLA